MPFQCSPCHVLWQESQNLDENVLDDNLIFRAETWQKHDIINLGCKIWCQSGTMWGHLISVSNCQASVASSRLLRNTSILVEAIQWCAVLPRTWVIYDRSICTQQPFCLWNGTSICVMQYQPSECVDWYVMRWLEAGTHNTFSTTNLCCLLGTNRFVGLSSTPHGRSLTCFSSSIHVIIQSGIMYAQEGPIIFGPPLFL